MISVPTPQTLIRNQPNLFKVLVEEKLSESSGCSTTGYTFGLLCSSSNQLVVGNPLQKIKFDDFGSNLKPLKCNNHVVRRAKLNCVERFVALTSTCLSIFDLEKEVVIRELHEHNGDVLDVAWHHSSPYQLASVGQDATLRLWDVRSHPAQASIRRAQRPFRCLQYSPDCSFVGCAGESISIFDLNSAQSVVHMSCSSPVTDVCFNPAECLLATASEDRLVRFWDVDSGECVTQSLPLESPVHCMQFHPEGKYLVVGTTSQISTLAWEPFEVLSQIKHSTSADHLTSTLLQMTIYKDRLMQLTVHKSKTQGSMVNLSSITLAQLEKCSAKDCRPSQLPPARPAALPPVSSSSRSSSSSGDSTSAAAMVYLPPCSSSTRSSMSNISLIGGVAVEASFYKFPTKKLGASATAQKSPPSCSTSFKLKQSRSRSCSTKSLNNGLVGLPRGSPSLASKQSPLPVYPSPMQRRQSTKSEKSISVSCSSESEELAKLCAMIKLSAKVRATAKRRKLEMTNLLNSLPANSFIFSSTAFSSIEKSQGIAAAELLLEEASKQEESTHLLAKLLQTYLLKPKYYSLGLNAIFLDKVRLLFSHPNLDYLTLALDLLEMVVQSFGDSIKHGLSSKAFSLGVDVAAEERYERCNKCRKALMQVQLSSSFLADRLQPGSQQLQIFTHILSQIDRILEDN